MRANTTIGGVKTSKSIGRIRSPGTVIAQLLYEVGAPAYVNPDVVAHFDTIRLAQVGPDRVALTAALATLSPTLRKAFVLHYIAQLSVAEIASEEDVAEGTVKSWLHRARALVAAALTDPREGN